MTGIRRKAGATDKEIERQNWAIFRRLEREAKAASADEGRSAPVEFRFAPSGVGEFDGYAMVWDTMDGHRTMFAPGSLQLPDTGIPLLFDHDPARPVGAVIEARADDRGLFIRGKLSLSTAAGADAFALVRDRAITGLSIGFKRIADEPVQGGRRITAAALKEVSLVALPSNESARITEVRASPAAGAAKPKEERKMPLDTTKPAPADSGENMDLSARVDALESTVTEIKSSVDEIKAAVVKTEARADRIEARSARNGLGGADKPTGELERRAFGSYLRSGDRAPAEELRALVVSNDP